MMHVDIWICRVNSTDCVNDIGIFYCCAVE